MTMRVGKGPRALMLALCLAGPASALALDETVTVPSGMPVAFHEMLWDDPGGGAIYRFRFLAPEIGGAQPRPYEEVAADMDFLCQDIAAPELAEATPAAARIVISLMAEPVEFGDPSPSVRQYFEAYSLRDGLCIWEAF
ncbi:DUF6497 family protein [Salipiger sp. P9]|uniref:DUF6497 family protein n=1 Tax=Salipiger pentaromativorans TaxID=2943193 RepID=UPI0021582B4E|nr:DUF6497 family protein [Salipiger pentaromativorans]MCR8546670.1 DUF6497 family protein [Salipiger pentaromativorans]